MKKKIFIASLILIAFAAKVVAQVNVETPKAKKDEKIVIKKIGKGKKGEKPTIVADEIIIVDNNADEKLSDDDRNIKKEKRITIMVDGDNITINGKPVDQLSNEDMKMLKGKANHLGAVAPFIQGTIKGTSDDGGHFNGNFKIPQDEFLKEPNAALLGVTTEKNEKGVVIISVSKGSAAEIFGLKKGDIITKINEDKITSSEDLMKAIGKYKPKDFVKITHIRDNLTLTGEVALGMNEVQQSRVFRWNDINNMAEEMAPMMRGEFDKKIFVRNSKPRIGVKIQDVEEGSGVKILEVNENTPAAKAGLLKDDIINEINGDAIKSVDDLREKISKAKEGDVYKIRYTRRGSSETVELKFPKKLKTADL